jgi:hypothetical protein
VKGVEMKLHAFVSLELDGGERSAAGSSRFNTEERTISIQWASEMVSTWWFLTQYHAM